jgi:hypothetical protein
VGFGFAAVAGGDACDGLAAALTGAVAGVCEEAVDGCAAISRGVEDDGGDAVFAPFRLPARIAATAITRTTTIRTFHVLRMSRSAPDNEIRLKSDARIRTAATPLPV